MYVPSLSVPAVTVTVSEKSPNAEYSILIGFTQKAFASVAGVQVISYPTPPFIFVAPVGVSTASAAGAMVSTVNTETIKVNQLISIVHALYSPSAKLSKVTV